MLVKGKNGYFPSDYAQIIETPVAAVVPPPPPPKPVASSSALRALRAKVMFDFSGTGKGEMPLKAGTTIDVVTRGPAGGWSKGAAGAFPTDYVQFIEPTSAVTNTIAAESKPFSASTASNFPVKSSIPASSAKSDPFADLPIPAMSNPVSSSTPAATSSNTFDPFDTPSSASKTRPQAGGFDTKELKSALSTLDNKNSAFNSDPFADLDNQSSTSTSTFANPAATVKTNTTTTTTINPASNVGSVPAGNSKPAASSEPTIFAIAKYSRPAGGATELTIEKGDTLIVLSNKDKDWWYGSIVGKSSKPGYFPSNYVELKANTVENPTAIASISARPASVAFPKAQPSTTAVAATAPSTMKAVSKASLFSTIMGQTKSYKAADANVYIPPQERKEKTIPATCTKAGLAGYKYVFTHPIDEKSQVPVWKLPLYIDLFADGYKSHYEKLDVYESTPVIVRIRTTLEAMLEVTKYVDLSVDAATESIRRVQDKVVYAIRDCIDICRMIPHHAEDMVRLYTFLVTFSMRVKSLRTGDFLLIPCAWTSENGSENAVFLLLMKEVDANFGGYAVSIINASDYPDSGLEYHIPHVNSVSGMPQRKLYFNLRNVPDERIQNTAFW